MATYDKEFIIRYAEDELTPEEKRSFEADMQNDPALAAELSLYREVKQTLQQRLAPDPQRDALRETLTDMGRIHLISKRISIVRWMSAAVAAASIIIIIMIWPSHNVENIDYPEMINTTARGSNTDSLLQQASTYFNHKQFDKALPLLDKAVEVDSTDQLALFYRGIAGCQTGSISKARKDLEQVYNGESVLRFEAAFYLALSYAKEKNTSAAREWLNKIPAGTPISAKAKELENNLKK